MWEGFLAPHPANNGRVTSADTRAGHASDVGFSQADWQELQINLDRIRSRERLNIPYQGERPKLPEKGHHPPPKGRSKPPEEPGYDVKYQRRLW